MEKIKINKEDNEIFLRFNDCFYDPYYIEEAINDFIEVCDIEKKDNGYVLKPKNPSDIDIVGYEFYNYVLGLLKNS